MAVIRQEQFLGQGRVDVPHLRSIESGVCNDFDLLAGKIITGKAPIIVNGFTLDTSAGTQASQLQLVTAGGVLMNYLASESGSMFEVPLGRANEVLNTANAKVRGSFTLDQMNYIGIDVVRSSDTTTADLVMFLDPDKGTESGHIIPLARTLDYIIVITTTPFDSTPGIAPVAKVFVTSPGGYNPPIDARNLLFRLGSGGTVPNPSNSYSWPQGRTETAAFTGGDKSLTNQKAWMDAVMSRLWEVSGGEHWYSPVNERNVKLETTGNTFDNGAYYEVVANDIHWKGLRVVLNNATGHFNDIYDQTSTSGTLTTLADGQCIYADLDYTATRTAGNSIRAVRGTYATLGVGAIPGTRMILAWRTGNDFFTRGASTPLGATSPITTVSGKQAVPLDGSAVLQVVNTSNVTDSASSATRALKVSANMGGTTMTALTIESGGAIGLVPITYPVVTPAPSGSDLVRAKLYIETIGTGPTAHDDLTIMYADGSKFVIHEGPLHG